MKQICCFTSLTIVPERGLNRQYRLESQGQIRGQEIFVYQLQKTCLSRGRFRAIVCWTRTFVRELGALACSQAQSNPLNYLLSVDFLAAECLQTISFQGASPPGPPNRGQDPCTPTGGGPPDPPFTLSEPPLLPLQIRPCYAKLMTVISLAIIIWLMTLMPIIIFLTSIFIPWPWHKYGSNNYQLTARQWQVQQASRPGNTVRHTRRFSCISPAWLSDNYESHVGLGEAAYISCSTHKLDVRTCQHWLRRWKIKLN